MMAKYVLVAEDDTDIQILVRDVLEDAGFDVGSAVGAETIAAVQARRPDLIMLDYNMPGMDGVRIAQALKADPETAEIPIVAMTAAGRAPMVCREMDAQGCLGKPFDIDHLVEAVDKLIHMTH
jgi:CheY-like chemotaxis protein